MNPLSSAEAIDALKGYAMGHPGCTLWEAANNARLKSGDPIPLLVAWDSWLDMQEGRRRPATEPCFANREAVKA